jgi:hypothetical protein
MVEFFTQTSDGPYLRHNYKLVFNNKKAQVFDNYQDTIQAWYNNPDQANYIEVLDGN